MLFARSVIQVVIGRPRDLLPSICPSIYLLVVVVMFYVLYIEEVSYSYNIMCVQFECFKEMIIITFLEFMYYKYCILKPFCSITVF